MRNEEDSMTAVDVKEQSNPPVSINVRQPYNKISNELREKIIHYLENGIDTRKSIASKFGIPYGTVISIYRRYILTGIICSKKKMLLQDTVLNYEQISFIKSLVSKNSTYSVKELQELFKDKYQVHLSNKTIQEFLTKFHFSIQRLSKITMPNITEKITLKRKTYCKFYKELITCGRVLIYFDEANFKVSACSSFTKTIMASMTNVELLYYKTFQGPGNQSCLLAYLKEFFSLLKIREITETVLIMNKTPSCQSDEEIRAFIQQAGHDILFITPYTPFLNPVYIMFSQYYKLIRSKHPSNDLELKILVKSFEGVVSQEDCSQYCNEVLESVELCLTDGI